MVLAVAAVHKAARLAQEIHQARRLLKGLQVALVLHKGSMAALAAVVGPIPEEAQEALQPAGLVVREPRHQFLALR